MVLLMLLPFFLPLGEWEKTTGGQPKAHPVKNVGRARVHHHKTTRLADKPVMIPSPADDDDGSGQAALQRKRRLVVDV